MEFVFSLFSLYFISMHIPKKRRFLFSQIAVYAAVIFISFLAYSDRLPIVSKNHDIGHADSAAYALQARGLAHTGSLKIPYVTNFFRSYDPEIWRYDDHWPPMLSVILSPFFRWYGVDAVIAHKVCLAIGTLLLPLAAAWLAIICSRRAWTGLFAAILVLSDPLIFKETPRVLGDVLLALLAICFISAIILSKNKATWFLLAGAMAAAAYFTKGSNLILVGMIPILAFIICGHRILKRLWLWLGTGLAIMLMLPWWMAMWWNYGNPLHSTQNYVSSFYGMEPNWDRQFYAVHWNKNLPKTTDRFTDREKMLHSMQSNTEIFLRCIFLGHDAKVNDWDSLGIFGRFIKSKFTDGRSSNASKFHPEDPWIFITHAIGLAWGSIAVLMWLSLLVRAIYRKFASGIKINIVLKPPLDRLSNAVSILLLIFAEAAFVIVFWRTENRFTIVLMPLLAVLCCLAINELVEWSILGMRALISWRHMISLKKALLYARKWGWTAVALLSMSISIYAWKTHQRFSDRQFQESRMHVMLNEQYPKYYYLARELEDLGIGKESIMMTRNPWEMLFYTAEGMRGVGLPYEKPEVIFAIARYYNVTHFVWDMDRPGLREFLRKGHPGLKMITSRPFPVYEIDWSQFKAGELSNLDE